MKTKICTPNYRRKREKKPQNLWKTARRRVLFIAEHSMTVPFVPFAYAYSNDTNTQHP